MEFNFNQSFLRTILVSPVSPSTLARPPVRGDHLDLGGRAPSCAEVKNQRLCVQVGEFVGLEGYR
jgi:hypothetical protein